MSDTLACRQANITRVCLPPDNNRKAILHMYLPLFVEPRDVTEAEALIDQFGKAAGLEAANRAEASRNLGNHLRYCRWRQIERLIIMLRAQTTLGTVH